MYDVFKRLVAWKLVAQVASYEATTTKKNQVSRECRDVTRVNEEPKNSDHGWVWYIRPNHSPSLYYSFITLYYYYSFYIYTLPFILLSPCYSILPTARENRKSNLALPTTRTNATFGADCRKARLLSVQVYSRNSSSPRLSTVGNQVKSSQDQAKST